MSYQVLARKWRPNSFASMVGQEAILRMLSNALDQQRLHHAYLFTGTRGIGKTTLARILAKCLNCESGITSKPCETCSTCQSINAGQFLDLFEIDAASRTKVEDTRELLDNVLYPPTQGRYKVYLIDEVHMLSNHSFNALLKTLEEPPAHVKFLLATTDPKKLPITILSRCLQFHLKRITPEQISHHLQHICNSENISYEASALAQIAKSADGSMRDALSLLDQAIAYGHGKVNAEEVNAMLGCMAQDDLLPLLQALAKQDSQNLFELVNKLAERMPDFHQVLEELITLFHHIAMAQIMPKAAVYSTYQALAANFTPEEVQLYYQIALLGRRDLALSPSPHQGFEMTMLRMLAFKPSKSPIQAPVQAKQQTMAATTVTPSAPAAASSTSITVNLGEWRDILPQLGLSALDYQLAANCVLIKNQDTRIELALSTKHQPMLNAKIKDRINQALSKVLGKTIQLDIQITEEEIETPAKQRAQENAQQLSDVKQAVMQNPKMKQLIDMYDASIDVSLIASS